MEVLENLPSKTSMYKYLRVYRAPISTTLVDHTDADRGSAGSGRAPEWSNGTKSAGSGERNNSDRMEVTAGICFFFGSKQEWQCTIGAIIPSIDTRRYTAAPTRYGGVQVPVGTSEQPLFSARPRLRLRLRFQLRLRSSTSVVFIPVDTPFAFSVFVLVLPPSFGFRLCLSLSLLFTPLAPMLTR